MRLLILLPMLLGFKSLYAQNAKISIKLSDKIHLIGLNIQEPFIDIEGYDGNDITLEVVPRIQKDIPLQAAGLKHISVSNRDKDNGVNILNPKIEEQAGGSVLSIALPRCNCEKIVIKVPRDPFLHVNMANFSREGAVSVKNINNGVYVAGFSPLIKVSNVLGFEIVSGGAKPGRRVSDRIMLSEINWSADSLISYGKASSRTYSVSAGSASIDICVPDTLKANLLCKVGSGKVLTDLKLVSLPDFMEKETNYMTPLAAIKVVHNIALNGGGINIHVNAKDGNIYLRRGK